MKKVMIFLFSLILLASCSSLKTIKTEDIKEKKFYFDYKETGNIGNVVIDMHDHTGKKESGGLISDAINTVGDVIKDIGTQFTADEMEKKLISSYQKVEFKKILNSDMKNTLVKIGRIKEAIDINDDYDYISTITLQRNEVLVNSEGVYLLISVNGNIYNRNTGKIVWDQTLSKRIQLSFEGSAKKSNYLGFKHIYDLMTIDEEKITKAMSNATKTISMDLSRILTSDLQN